MKRDCLLAVGWLAALSAAAVLAPFLLTNKSGAVDFSHLLEAPSRFHWFGTDALGRDLFARILVATSISLTVAWVAVILSVFLGVVIGAVAGYFGGGWDRSLMAFVNIMLCFPVFFLILSVIAVLGPNIFNVMVIIGATSWMGTARLVRAEVLSLKEREFVLAARALGASHALIIFRHLVPNAMGPVIVNAVLGLAAAVLVESGLSFLGIGVQPPTPSWGNLLSDGKGVLGVAWWLTFFPGVMIFLTILSANTLGEALQSKNDS